ncbi:hypothetical protein [Kineococcus sp. SYSU DK005]|uniref:hypothetical protein n=1 Tax=Kineococcus sp. SYSU DK005 TaxID=3383126 RepID=UPI003D7DBD50
MPQQYRTDTTVLAINNTDASGTAHVVAFREHGVGYGEWNTAVEDLTRDPEEPFGFRAEVGIAQQITDPITALNLIDRYRFFLGAAHATEPGEDDELEPVAYVDDQPCVHVRVTMQDLPGTLARHVSTILALLRCGPQAEFVFTARSQGLLYLPQECLHLSITYLDAQRPDVSVTVCPDALSAAGEARARQSASANGTDHLVCMPEAAPVLRHLLAA